MWVGVLLAFFGLLAVSFLARSWLGENRAEKVFYGRFAAFLAFYTAVVTTTLSAQASGHYQQGHWLDLTWTLAYALLIVLAGTWNEKETERTTEARSNTLQLIALFSPLKTFYLAWARSGDFCRLMVIDWTFSHKGMLE